MENIGYCYDRNRILNDVDFEIHGGEIIALLGENGAGKSTLMNILGGVLPLTEGKIYFDGEETNFSSPTDSIAHGVGFIHQELNLIADLTVYENLFISAFPKKGIFLDKAKMIFESEKLFRSLDIDINPRTLVRDLDVSYKQITEICRVLLQNAKIIIMDEPTTSLTTEETGQIFKIMRLLKKNGVGIVFISHKLGEVMQICDTYTVIRNGEIAEKGNIKDTSIKQLSEFIVGHEISENIKHREAKYGKEILRLENFTDRDKFNNISLSVYEGQILGVTGLLGDGRSEIFQTIFGARDVKIGGHVYYRGKKIKPYRTDKSVNDGITYIPADRKDNGILKDMSVIDNTTIENLNNMKNGLFISEKICIEKFNEQKENFRIKTENFKNLITGLSGGNQQKTVIAKSMMTNPKLLILDNPTQGVDIGAKAEIYAKIKELADSGVAIVWLSPEAKEIAENCESAYVLFHGRIAGYLSGEELNEYAIMNYATGGK